MMDGARGEVSNSIFSDNSPVESLFYATNTEGVTPAQNTTISIFQTDVLRTTGPFNLNSMIWADTPNTMIEMERMEIEGNQGYLANIGAYFGGNVRLFRICFDDNTATSVTLILEGSSYEADINYVGPGEVSSACDGLSELPPFDRLAVEIPGSNCLAPGVEICPVDCFNGTNTEEACRAKEVLSEIPSQAPTALEAESDPPTEGQVDFSSPPTTSASPSERPSASPSISAAPSTTQPTLEQVVPSFPPTVSPAPSETVCEVHPTACIPTAACDDPPQEGLCVDENSCVAQNACVGASDAEIGPNSCTGIDSCRDFTDGTVGPNSCLGFESCADATGDIGGGSCQPDNACTDFAGTSIGDNSCNCVDCCSCWETGQLPEVIPDNSCNEPETCCKACFIHPTACVPSGSCDDPPPESLCVDEGSCAVVEACAGASDADIGPNSCLGFRACRDFTDGSVGDGSCNFDNSCERASTDVGSNSCNGVNACADFEGTSIGDNSCNVSQKIGLRFVQEIFVGWLSVSLIMTF